MGSGVAARLPPHARPAALLAALLLVALLRAAAGAPSPPSAALQVLNITRIGGGDAFFVTGDECGVTHCEEASGGTALSDRPPGASGPPCACRCRTPLPLFREDRLTCVNDITECPVAEFGSGNGASRVPLVFLPLSGQIIHPSKEINFPEITNAICAISSAQFLTKTGWSSLREEEDNDVPFSLYRDEGKTFLMWRGSEGTRDRLTGRAVLVRLACWVGTRLLLPCAAFRVSGTPPDTPNDMTEVFFSLGAAPVDTERAPWSAGAGMGAPLLLCALVATLLYAGALLMYLRAKRRMMVPRANIKLDENSEMEMPNTKTNPLLSLDVFLTDSRRMSGDILTDKEDSTSRAYSSQSSSRTDSLNDRSKDDEIAKDEIEEFDVIQPSTVSATIHRVAGASRLGPPPPRPGPGSLPRSGHCTLAQQSSVERRPEQHVAIVDEDDIFRVEMASVVPPPGNARKKLYFNPAFLEPQMLKTPPPAAVEFLSKIREVIGIAKDKMQAKRFVQILPTIMEEHSCQSPEVTLSNGLYKSKSVAFSLKRENSRRRSYCSGCPGCKSTNKSKDIFLKTLSEKKFCKTCISGDLKHNIVKKWLDDVPLIETCEVGSLRFANKSVTKINGTPKSIEPVLKKDSTTVVRKIEPDIKKEKKISEVTAVIKSRKKLPPPPAPPQRTTSVIHISPQPPKENEPQDRTSAELKKKDEDVVVRFIPPELKQKMNAVINELSKFRRIDPILPRLISLPVSEVVTPFIPKLVVSITPKVVIPETNNIVESINPHVKLSEHVEIATRFPLTGHKKKFEADSLERSGGKRRASLSNIDFAEVRHDSQRSHKRRSSIIAMDELEPMKKIYEMNSRLSKSYQGIDATSQALEKMNKTISVEDNSKSNCKSYAIQITNLVSEVYINDYVNTMSSTSDSDVSLSNTSLNVNYAEPVSRPGQLVIKVDNPTDRNVQKYCDDFDADTLDRKPEKLKIHSEINLNFTSPKAKTFEQIFLKSSGSFKAKSSTGLDDSIYDNDICYRDDRKTNSTITRQKKPSSTSNSVPYFSSVDNRYDALLEKQDDDNDYENCVLNRDCANTNFRSLSSIFLERKEQIKPPLPPKKVVGNRQECVWNKQNTYKVQLPSRDNQVSKNHTSRSNTPSMNFRITRSEPPPRNINILEDTNSYNYPKIQVPKVNKTIRNYTTFGSMDYSYNRPEETGYKPADPNYENYSPYAEVYREPFRSIDEGAEYLGKLTKHSKERENFSMKKPLRRSIRNRQKRMQQTKQHKTEDSGYLSSDSNESRHRSKFILQVREKHEISKEAVTDTDDLESLGDARSESGGESIETNSVFFGSFRRAGPVKGRHEKLCKEEDSGFNSDMLRNDEEKELRSVISIISPRGRLAALDDL